MQFRDREQAAGLLARELKPYEHGHPIVLGLSRAGVLMSATIADQIGADLDIMLIGKLRSPRLPDVVIGTVDEAGHVHMEPSHSEHPVSDADLAAETQRELRALSQQRKRYTPGRSRRILGGRIVILVDDGLVTGTTALAAARAAQSSGAGLVIVAVPVAPAAAIALLHRDADEVICLHTAADFVGIARFYADFREVGEGEAAGILEAAYLVQA